MEIIRNTQIITIIILMTIYMGIVVSTKISKRKTQKVIDDMFKKYENKYQ